MADVKKLITEHLDIWLTAEIEKKSGRGRSSGSNDTIYGVQKLRELILDLGISGNLTEQTHADASELLNNILKEKAKLVATGLLKKQKKLIDIIDLKKPFLIPTNWRWVQLGEVTNYGISDRGFEITENTWVLDLEDIEKDSSKLLKKVLFSQRPSLSEKNSFKEGDVLYGKLRPYLNKVIVADERGVCSSEIMAFSTYVETDSNFFKYVLKSSYFLNYVNSKSYGMKMPRLGTEDARNALLPLPPLEEQQLIVSKVDELMQICDQLEQQQNLSSEAHNQLVDTLLSVLTNSSDVDEFQQNWQRILENFDLLFTTEYSIEQLKQTILQLAMMGKLVKQDVNDEPASELLKKIAVKKAKLIESKIIRKSKNEKFVNKEDILFPLPNSWDWIRMHQVSYKVTDGAHHTPKYVDKGIPFLSVKDMSSGFLDFSDTRFISEAEHNELYKRCNPEQGDLLITKVGTTGIPIVVDTEKVFSLFVSVALVKSFWDYIDVDYLSLQIASPFVLKQSKDGTEGVGNKNLVLKKIENFLLVLPPLNEQKRIVVKVNQLFSVIEKLKSLQSKLQKTQLYLADALVANALTGSSHRKQPEVTESIIQFRKPIEAVKTLSQKSTDQIDLFADESVKDDIKLLALAAEITFQLHAEPTFGHLKLQKLIFLCQQLKHMDLAADFKQHAAGPYDRNIATYIDTEFKKREWFSYHKDEIPKYKQLRKCNDHRLAFNQYFATDISEIYNLIGLFRTSKSDHIEIVATLFACWLRLLEKKQSVTEEQLLKDFYAWSEAKKKFSQKEILNGLVWMKQNSVVPV